MIQRIQSVFLFVSLCLLCSMFFIPAAGLVYGGGEVLSFSLVGFYKTETGAVALFSGQYSVMALGILICVLTVATIFMYKRRALQLRLCSYSILLLAGLIGVALYTVYHIQNVQSVVFRLPAVFPVISVILHCLAFRGIRKDDRAVQASNRLR